MSTAQDSGLVLPGLIAGAGKPAARRFREFFTVNIRNRNTRAAYARAAGAFLRWCEGQGIGELRRIEAIHVAAYVEQRSEKMSPPSVKQHLAAIRMLFDWLATGKVVSSNPAHAVRVPRHSVSKGATPVLSSKEATELLGGMNVATIVGLRDRAILAVMTYNLRPRRRRGRAHGRGLLRAEKAPVAAPPREKRQDE